MITLIEIHERLKKEIKQSKKTQTEIAKLIQVRQQTVSEYIHGRSMPALDTFANLCKTLDVDPAYILCIRDE